MLNKLISNIALGKQSAKGTAATAPDYTTPLVGSGAVAGVDPTITIDEETGQVYAINAYKEEVATGFDAPVRAYPKTMGFLLYGLFGSCTTTEQNGLYQHVFTVDPTDMTTPWYTMWGNIEDEEVKTVDAKVGALELSFEGNAPVEVSATFAALSAVFGAAAARPQGGTDMAGLKYFTPANVDVKVDVAGSTLETKKITAFTLTMSRNIEPEYFSGSPMPGDLAMGKFECAPTITTKPDDLADFRKSLTGSANGTEVSPEVVEGGYEVTLTQGDNMLKIESPRVPWHIAWPESDAGGGAVELELSADNALGTVTSGPITITLVNDVASYA